MPTPLDALLDATAFRCTCCNAPVEHGRPSCDCWSDRVDQCTASDGFGCVRHCRCARCAHMRTAGFESVNWTGLEHVAPVGHPTTLCGRAIGGPPVWRKPILRLVPRDSWCQRCHARATAAWHGPEAPGPPAASSGTRVAG